LKRFWQAPPSGGRPVAPRAGAWIETYKRNFVRTFMRCRPPRGGVD